MTWLLPVAGLTLLGFTGVSNTGRLGVVASGLGRFGTVLTTVRHAGLVAHGVGEPFGALALALAVTVIQTPSR